MFDIALMDTQKFDKVSNLPYTHCGSTYSEGTFLEFFLDCGWWKKQVFD